MISQLDPTRGTWVYCKLFNQLWPEGYRPITHYIASQFQPDGHVAKDAAFNQEVLTVQDNYCLACQFWPGVHRPITNYFVSYFWPEGYLSVMHQVLCSLEGYQHFHIIQCIGCHVSPSTGTECYISFNWNPKTAWTNSTVGQRTIIFEILTKYHITSGNSLRSHGLSWLLATSQ